MADEKKRKHHIDMLSPEWWEENVVKNSDRVYQDFALPQCQKCGSQMGAVGGRCTSCGSDQGFNIPISIVGFDPGSAEGDDSVLHQWRQRPERCDLDAPCNKCPFRINSLPGWLGPWSLMELHNLIMHEVYFPCHQTIQEVGKEEGTSFCVGALIYMTNCVKVPKRDQLREAQDYYNPLIDPLTILDFAGYMEHHGLARPKEEKDAPE